MPSGMPQDHHCMRALPAAEKLRLLHEWEGHDFSRAVKLLKMRPRFSACGVLFAPTTSFSQSVEALDFEISILIAGF
jgi:hypothetical protein